MLLYLVVGIVYRGIDTVIIKYSIIYFLMWYILPWGIDNILLFNASNWKTVVPGTLKQYIDWQWKWRE